MDITLIAELLLFVLLMLMSGFFSSSETSLFSLNQMQIEQMRRDGNPRVNLIERLLSEPRRLIVTILIGNEFVNVAASVISAAIVIRLLGAENKMVNLFIMVPILLLIGEITPKTLAIRNNMAFATVQSRPIDAFARLIAPLRWLIRQVAEWLTTLVIGREFEQGSIVTRDMVRTLAHEAVGDGALNQNEALYIEQIFDFGNRTVEDLMTPRSNVLFFPADMSYRDIVAELKRTRHTKVPVFREQRDTILGILHARDLLAQDAEALEREPDRWRKILREPYFVPETKPAADLFHSFRKRRLSVAMVVDEYGGVTGLISMEDLLECIFGDIPSPSDTIAEPDFPVRDDGATLIDGTLPIDRFNEKLDADIATGEFETIGGRILHEFGELPGTGEEIRLDNFSFRVEAVEENRLKTLSVRKTPVTGKAPEQADEGERK